MSNPNNSCTSLSHCSYPPYLERSSSSLKQSLYFWKLLWIWEREKKNFHPWSEQVFKKSFICRLCSLLRRTCYSPLDVLQVCHIALKVQYPKSITVFQLRLAQWWVEKGSFHVFCNLYFSLYLPVLWDSGGMLEKHSYDLWLVYSQDPFLRKCHLTNYFSSSFGEE